MNKKTLFITTLSLFVFFIFTSCEEKINTDSPYIEGLSINNYPIIDGSTSTLPLNTVIACELLGLNYKWQENKTTATSKTWSIEPKINSNLRKKINHRVRSSQTHNSFINLIDNEVDIALVARPLSPDEKAYADSKGVTLIETPIALDAFIFIVNPRNTVEGLTTENIQNIYTGKITNWTILGVESIYPDYAIIHPYIRNPNSGSQELMDLLIMKDLEYINLPIYEEALVFTMAGLLDEIAGNPFSIGYTVHYYNEYIIRPTDNYLKTIAVDGVLPTTETITNQSYPYTTEIYAVIRSDTDQSSMIYKVYEWLQTEEGKRAIRNSGYIVN